MRNYAILALALLSGTWQSAQAELLTVDRYDTFNGDNGSYTYIDDDYTGSGDPLLVGGWLSGGVGKLTDGVIASDSWYVSEQRNNVDTNGSYLGWVTHQQVSITFYFNQLISLERFSVYADDGEHLDIIRHGGVAAPSMVSLDGGNNYALGDIKNGGPNSYQFSVTPFITDHITLTFTPTEKYWIFLSEISFEGKVANLSDSNIVSDVPTPASTPLYSLALAGLLFARCRRA